MKSKQSQLMLRWKWPQFWKKWGSGNCVLKMNGLYVLYLLLDIDCNVSKLHISMTELYRNLEFYKFQRVWHNHCTSNWGGWNEVIFPWKKRTGKWIDFKDCTAWQRLVWHLSEKESILTDTVDTIALHWYKQSLWYLQRKVFGSSVGKTA